MGKRLYPLLYVAAGLVLTLAPMGCARTPAVKYYTLSAVQSPAPASRDLGDAGQPAVGIGPVRIPDYLDRFQIVTRYGPGLLEINDFHKWAEPLPGNITRVLVQNISTLLPPSPVMGFPWSQSVPMRYKIPIDILSFEAGDAGNVTLLARWRIYDRSSGNAVITRESRIMIEIANLDYTTVVSAQSRALAELGREIATAVQGLGQP